jgi:hypothetical protein
LNDFASDSNPHISKFTVIRYTIQFATTIHNV